MRCSSVRTAFTRPHQLKGQSRHGPSTALPFSHLLPTLSSAKEVETGGACLGPPAHFFMASIVSVKIQAVPNLGQQKVGLTASPQWSTCQGGLWDYASARSDLSANPAAGILLRTNAGLTRRPEARASNLNRNLQR